MGGVRQADEQERRAGPGHPAHLINVATRLFAAHGYDGTSIEAVLAESGASRGSLYHHFSGKDALFWAVLESVGARVAQRGAEATRDADPVAALRPDLADGEVRLAVHAAIRAIQSTLFFRSGLADERLTELLEIMAHGCLGTTPVHPSHARSPAPPGWPAEPPA